MEKVKQVREKNEAENSQINSRKAKRVIILTNNDLEDTESTAKLN